MDISEIISANTHIVPDFPKPEAVYMNYEPLKANANAFVDVVEAFREDIQTWSPDLIIGHESRKDFVAALAAKMGLGFAEAHHRDSRTPGAKYTDKTLYINASSLEAAQQMSHRTGRPFRAAFVDELVISGADALSVLDMVRQAGGQLVHAAFLIEVKDQGARQALNRRGVSVTSLSAYTDEGIVPGSDINTFPQEAANANGNTSIGAFAEPGRPARYSPAPGGKDPG